MRPVQQSPHLLRFREAKAAIPTGLSKPWIKNFPQATARDHENCRERGPGRLSISLSWESIRSTSTSLCLCDFVMIFYSCSGWEQRLCSSFPFHLPKRLGSALTYPVFPGATGILSLEGFQPFQDFLTSILKNTHHTPAHQSSTFTSPRRTLSAWARPAPSNVTQIALPPSLEWLRPRVGATGPCQRDHP